MKNYLMVLVKRGLMAAAGGPVILALIYLYLGQKNLLTQLTPEKAAVEILTVSLLAFLAAGVSVVYQIEHLSLLPATLIHAAAVYLDYLLIYCFNGWLEPSAHVLLGFTGIFLVGYLVIWLCVYAAIRRSIQKMNTQLGEVRRGKAP